MRPTRQPPFARLDVRLRLVEAHIAELESWLADIEKRLRDGRALAAALRERMVELIADAQPHP